MSIQSAMAALREFHEVYGAHIEERPTVDVPKEVKKLRIELIREEFEELAQALIGDPDIRVRFTYSAVEPEQVMVFTDFHDDELLESDLVETADALIDILYVVYGACVSLGIPVGAVFDEVHRSNMSKLGEDGKPIYREDGKVTKGPNYFKPDIAGVLAAYSEDEPS